MKMLLVGNAGVRCVVTGMVLLAAAISPYAGAEADRPVNVIFAMTDDQGYGDVGYMGHRHLQTPVLDRMAENGLRLDRFYAAAPVCSPTRASVITGRHPNRSGTLTWGSALREQEHTVATALREAGYRTGFFGKWHVGSVRAGQPTSPGGHGFDVWSAAPNFYENDPWFSRNGTATQVYGESSAVTVEEALPFIREAVESNEPFFAVVWFGAPHIPHDAVEELKALYPGLPEQLQNYYGEITGVDTAMGMIRDELRELGIEGDTVLWFTSDNGGRPQDGAEHRGLRGAKGELWEGGIRVPALVEWPGRIEPRISRLPAGTVDIYPTLLELAGVEPGHARPMDGISLVPFFEGRMQSRSQPLGFWQYGVAQGQLMHSDNMLRRLYEQQQAGQPEDINDGRVYGPDLDYPEADDRPGPSAWIDGAWKLHRRDNGDHLLFHLVDDEGEQNNLIDQHPERAQQMQAELREWEESVIGSMRGEDY
ncbi:MAG: sulfatase-like hydrolase/transferase [Opitutales bacterium]